MKIEDLDVNNHKGKRLRGEHLVRLKDLRGLRYSKINDTPPFDNLKFLSLPQMYKDRKRRLENDNGKNS